MRMKRNLNNIIDFVYRIYKKVRNVRKTIQGFLTARTSDILRFY